MKPKKSNLKSNLRKLEKIGQELSGVKLSSNPNIARLELQALGIIERVKKEGLNG